MITRTASVTLSLSLCAAAIACSASDGVNENPGLGGSDGVGGESTSKAGSTATGGKSGVGGTSQHSTTRENTAGGVSTGGAAATGGRVGQGGSTSTGAKATGGAGATGGKASQTGGAAGTGGSKTAGGSAATGGAKGNTGGAVSTGGSKGGGGAATTGGSSSAGGGSASGGKAGTGGSTSAGGAASFKCDNLSLAPSATGKPKPSSTAGGLKVLDWAGFTGAVSFTFDDNTPSQMANYAAMKATGAHFTWFVVGSWNPSSQYKSTLADGQEIANHSYSHNQQGSETDLQQNETYISTNFGVTAYSMAAPNCDGSWAKVAPSVLFQNRGPCSGSAATVSPRDNTDPFLLPAYLPATGASSSTLDGTLSAGKWRIHVIHGFDSQNGTYQPIPINNVTTSMSNAISKGYWVETMTNVGAYWQGQKAISASASTSATWTLPAHFPKNMCVRITTSGGTVMQNGKEVPWDDHGYYQISLDALSVTIQ